MKIKFHSQVVIDEETSFDIGEIVDLVPESAWHHIRNGKALPYEGNITDEENIKYIPEEAREVVIHSPKRGRKPKHLKAQDYEL